MMSDGILLGDKLGQRFLETIRHPNHKLGQLVLSLQHPGPPLLQQGGQQVSQTL
jgi:hypothetical protein